MAKPTDLHKLESILDDSTLYLTIEGLVEVCRAKAEHLREHWQDDSGARQWSKAATRIEQLLSHSDVRYL
jgi:hypothetical protein